MLASFMKCTVSDVELNITHTHYCRAATNKETGVRLAWDNILMFNTIAAVLTSKML